MLRCTRCECIKLDRAHHCRYCTSVITYEPIIGHFPGGSPGKYNFVWGLIGGIWFTIQLYTARKTGDFVLQLG